MRATVTDRSAASWASMLVLCATTPCGSRSRRGRQRSLDLPVGDGHGHVGGTRGRRAARAARRTAAEQASSPKTTRRLTSRTTPAPTARPERRRVPAPRRTPRPGTAGPAPTERPRAGGPRPLNFQAPWRSSRDIQPLPGRGPFGDVRGDLDRPGRQRPLMRATVTDRSAASWASMLVLCATTPCGSRSRRGRQRGLDLPVGDGHSRRGRRSGRGPGGLRGRRGGRKPRPTGSAAGSRPTDPPGRRRPCRRPGRRVAADPNTSTAARGYSARPHAPAIILTPGRQPPSPRRTPMSPPSPPSWPAARQRRPPCSRPQGSGPAWPNSISSSPTATAR